MSQNQGNPILKLLMQCGGALLLLLAAQSFYLGFLSPMNKGQGMAGGAVLLITLFGAPGAYLIYKAQGSSDKTVQRKDGE